MSVESLIAENASILQDLAHDQVLLNTILEEAYTAIINKGGAISAKTFVALAPAIRNLKVNIPSLITSRQMVVTPEPVTGNIWYVKPNGTGDKNGTSWEHAFATRQEAVNAASYGDHIRVWEGLYYLESIQRPKTGVSEYYGFNDDGSWEKRHPFSHPSIHDALFTSNNYENTTVTFLDAQVVDGLWIQNVVKTGSGGGAYLNAKSNFRNCIILNNNATNGGGVYVNNGGVLTNCVSVNNNVSSTGGGLYVIGSSTVINCVCINNTAGTGGGIYIALATARGCIVVSNYSSGEGGGICSGHYVTIIDGIVINNSTNRGGGIYIAYNDTCVNCVSINNYARSYGGGICLTRLDSCINITAAMNSAPLGDNFYSSSSESHQIYNCVSWGGTIYLGQPNVPHKIYNCASNFPLTGITNWDTNVDIRNFIPLSTFPFVSTGDTSYDNSGAFYHANILGRNELALEFINNKLLPNLIDVHLPVNSPLIGAGYYEAGVTPDLDADGIVRPLPPSIGAYEYVP